MPRRITALILGIALMGVTPLASPSSTANASPLGVVIQAQNAHFNAAKISEGATVYDGDLLSTEAEGSLQFRSTSARVYLPSSSGVSMHALPSGTQTTLRIGSVVFSTSKASAMEILADKAFIRPAADGPTMALITLVSPKELKVAARRGALEVSFNGETENLAEGATYRVMLEPPPAPRPDAPQMKKSGRMTKGFYVVLFGSIGVVTYFAVDEALESPDRP